MFTLYFTQRKTSMLMVYILNKPYLFKMHKFYLDLQKQQFPIVQLKYIEYCTNQLQTRMHILFKEHF